MPKFWLLKSEPESFSIQDLAKAPKKTTCWSGLRNYQARNFMRDEMKIGDRVHIRGLVQSDCLGLTGRILDIHPSALFGRGIQRCKVDFNGKIRRLLNIHLVHASRRTKSNALTAA